MKKKYKELWLKALRGESKLGVYSQTQGSLSKDYGGWHTFCCLGVLQNEVEGFWKKGVLTYCYSADPEKYNSSFLREEILAEVGLEDKHQRTLARMNDSGHPFEGIALYIEKNL